MKMLTFKRKKQPIVDIDTISTITLRTPWGTVPGLRIVGADFSGGFGENDGIDVTLRLVKQSVWEKKNRV